MGGLREPLGKQAKLRKCTMDLLSKIDKFVDLRKSDLLRELSTAELKKLGRTAPCPGWHILCEIVHCCIL